MFLLIGQNVSAQNKAADNALANYEKSIAQGKIADIEKPLLAYAVAHPNDFKPLELLAQIRLQQGRLTEARGLYQRVLVLNPNALDAKINLGQIYYALGQKEDAQQILNGITADSIAAPKTRLELAASLISIGETEKAAKIIETLPPNLKNGDALPLLAVINLEAGNRQKLLNLIPLMKKSAANSSLAIQNAEILQSGGFFTEAAELLRAALASAPKNPNLLARLGRLEVYERNFTQARQHLNRAAAVSPDSAEILSAQALLESSEGKLTTAFDLLSKAREIAPDSAAVLADFVVVAMRSGKARAAVEAAKLLAGERPGDAEPQYLLGAAQLQNNNIAGAQQSLESFTRQRPLDSRGCLALGLTLAAQLDKIEIARRQLNHCLEIDPANFEAKYQLGLSYKAQGDAAPAIRLLEEVVRQKPDYAPALRDLGALYLQTNDEEKARVVLEKSVALAPDDAETHFQLSRLYNLLGNSQLAKQHLEMFQKIKNGGKVSP
ncbi:MAG: tetratricopeptide repeat protein [Pyrinomonadaceae bacterium]